MKKFGKFLFGSLSVAAAVGGLYCLYKNKINKNADNDFDDCDDDSEEADATVSVDPENREYVSITITSEDAPAEETAGATEEAETSAPAEEAEKATDAE